MRTREALAVWVLNFHEGTMFAKVLLLGVFTILAASASPSLARTATYRLDPANSDVGFAWNFGQDEVKGHMPVESADLTIDFSDVSRSTVAVAVNVQGAEAGFPFASQAMKGPKVLDAANFPLISFTSTKVTQQGDKARIDGLITIRGVTKPATLIAQLYRPQGSDPDDMSNLSIRLVGAVSRAAFGADGWSDMAGDEVRLNILARISEVK